MAKKESSGSRLSTQGATGVSWTPSTWVDMAVPPPYSDRDGTKYFQFADQSKHPPTPMEPLMLLGGSHNRDYLRTVEEFESRVPKDSVFRGLDRPDCLPIFTVFTPMSKADRKFCDGFLVGRIFMVCVERESYARIMAVWPTEQGEAQEGAKMTFQFNYGHEFAFECSGGNNNLDNEQHEKVIYGVLHRFIRAYGSFLEPMTARRIVHYLQNYYTSNRLYKELVDTRIIFADLHVLRNYNSCYHHNIVSEETMCNNIALVGEALAARGKFRLAAALFLECKDIWVRGVHLRGQSLFYHEAGLAFKRSGDFQLAQENYTRAMWCEAIGTNPRHWDVNGETVGPKLSSLATLLLQAGGHDGFIFSGLLASSGCKQFQKDVPSTTIHQLSTVVIQDKFRDSQRATIAIFESFLGGTIQSFQGKLQGYQIMPLSSLPGLSSINVPRKEARAGAREKLDTGTTMQTVSCCSPDCDTKVDVTPTTKCCPCHKVLYCSKECQVKHWKAHKKVCLWKKQKMEQPAQG